MFFQIPKLHHYGQNKRLYAVKLKIKKFENFTHGDRSRSHDRHWAENSKKECLFGEGKLMAEGKRGESNEWKKERK